MSDTRYRTALRDALASPTKTNIEALTQATLRAGVLLPLARTRKAHHLLAGEMHLVGTYLRQGGHPAFAPSSWMQPPKRRRIRKTLALAVRGGLPREDLETILRAGDFRVPRTIWSPGGEDFDEILRPQDYDTSRESFTEIYIGYSDSTVTCLDAMADLEWSDDDDSMMRLQGYRAMAHRGFSFEDIGEDELAEIASNVNEPVEEVRRILSTPGQENALAQACFDVRHQIGPEWDDSPLVFDTPAAVARHFALEIAMQDRGWLR